MSEIPTAAQRDQQRQIKDAGLDWNWNQRNKGKEKPEPTPSELLGETPIYDLTDILEVDAGVRVQMSEPTKPCYCRAPDSNEDETKCFGCFGINPSPSPIKKKRRAKK